LDFLHGIIPSLPKSSPDLFLDLFFLETLELSTSSSIRRGIGIDDDVDNSSVSKKKRSGDGLGNVGMMP
jgi:hypothetical protein